MKSNKVYCLISVCSSFVMFFKFYIVLYCYELGRGVSQRGVVVVWQETALLMSCYRV
jgi:hypothetical protein